MNKLVDEAPYHPGYEDAVVPPKQVYSGMNAGKMIWKSTPLSEEEILQAYADLGSKNIVEFAKVIERMHGIK